MKNWQKNLALTAFLAFLAGSFYRGWMKAGADIENPKILAEMRDAMVRMAPPPVSADLSVVGYFCFKGFDPSDFYHVHKYVPGNCFEAVATGRYPDGIIVFVNENTRVDPKSVKRAVFGE